MDSIANLERTLDKLDIGLDLLMTRNIQEHRRRIDEAAAAFSIESLISAALSTDEEINRLHRAITSLEGARTDVETALDAARAKARAQPVLVAA